MVPEKMSHDKKHIDEFLYVDQTVQEGGQLSSPSSVPGIPAHFMPEPAPTPTTTTTTSNTSTVNEKPISVDNDDNMRPTPTRKKPSSSTSTRVATPEVTTAAVNARKGTGPLGTHGFFQLFILVLVPILSMRAMLMDWPSTRKWICAHARCHDSMPARHWHRMRQDFSFVNIGGTMITAGSILLSLDSDLRVLVLEGWQIQSVVGFGYGIFVVGVLYVIVGLIPSMDQEHRDRLSTASIPSLPLSSSSTSSNESNPEVAYIGTRRW
ncbi:hypothetical protein BGZ94_009627 [Podila epigama]|nr:hypothetical protein BGZ94_009627 [Podila epigama]